MNTIGCDRTTSFSGLLRCARNDVILLHTVIARHAVPKQSRNSGLITGGRLATRDML